MIKGIGCILFLAFGLSCLAAEENACEVSLDPEQDYFSNEDLINLLKSHGKMDARIRSLDTKLSCTFLVLMLLVGASAGIPQIVMGSPNGIIYLASGAGVALFAPIPFVINKCISKRNGERLSAWVTGINKTYEEHDPVDEKSLLDFAPAITKERHNLLKRLNFNQAIILVKFDLNRLRYMVYDYWFSDKITSELKFFFKVLESSKKDFLENFKQVSVGSIFLYALIQNLPEETRNDPEVKQELLEHLKKLTNIDDEEKLIEIFKQIVGGESLIKSIEHNTVVVDLGNIRGSEEDKSEKPALIPES